MLKNSSLRMLHKYPNRQQLRSIQGSGNPGAGAGRGGGGGGAIRESGGGLGQYGVAQEEGYFYKKQTELLKRIKEQLKNKPKKDPAQKPAADE